MASTTKLSKRVPASIKLIWSWLKPFSVEAQNVYPNISEIVLEGKSIDGIEGCTRRVTYTNGRKYRERLVYVDDIKHVLVYIVLGMVDGDKKIIGSGTTVTLNLDQVYSEVDSSPETVIHWEAIFDEQNLKDVEKSDLTESIESCFAKFDERFNEVIGKLFITLKRARKLMTADLVTSDPYVKFNLINSSEEQKSTVKKWTTNPDWMQHFEMCLRPRTTELMISVWDYDGVAVNGDDPMGSTSVDFHELTNGVSKDYELNLDTKGTVEITLRIEMIDGKDIPLNSEWLSKLRNVEQISVETRLAEARNDLIGFVKCKCEKDMHIKLSEDKANFMSSSYLYLSTVDDLPMENLDIEGDCEDIKKCSIRSLKKLLEND